MKITYPRELVFAFKSGVETHQWNAVVLAAEALDLKVVKTYESVSVTIASPIEAYRFGQKVREFIRSGAPPMPLSPVPPELEGVDDPRRI